MASFEACASWSAVEKEKKMPVYKRQICIYYLGIKRKWLWRLIEGKWNTRSGLSLGIGMYQSLWQNTIYQYWLWYDKCSNTWMLSAAGAPGHHKILSSIYYWQRQPAMSSWVKGPNGQRGRSDDSGGPLWRLLMVNKHHVNHSLWIVKKSR